MTKNATITLVNLRRLKRSRSRFGIAKATSMEEGRLFKRSQNSLIEKADFWRISSVNAHNGTRRQRFLSLVRTPLRPVRS